MVVWVSGLNHVSAKDTRVTPPLVRIQMLPQEYKHKIMKLKDYIELKYNNFRDSVFYDDYNDDELTSKLLFDSSNLLSEIIYLNRKREKETQDEKIKDLFEIISILTKINNINLED